MMIAKPLAYVPTSVAKSATCAQRHRAFRRLHYCSIYTLYETIMCVGVTIHQQSATKKVRRHAGSSGRPRCTTTQPNQNPVELPASARHRATQFATSPVPRHGAHHVQRREVVHVRDLQRLQQGGQPVVAEPQRLACTRTTRTAVSAPAACTILFTVAVSRTVSSRHAISVAVCTAKCASAS